MTGFAVQIVVDCDDPHMLADWWAETLRWAVEPQDESFIRSMIDQGHATEAETRLHKGALVWRDGAAINRNDEAAPGAPRILFQRVPEAKTAKNRLHLDVRVGDEDPAAIRDALVARGARVVHEGRQGPHTWLTMADPEGNEFCV